MSKVIPFILCLLSGIFAYAQNNAPNLEVEPLIRGIYVHTSYALFNGQPTPSNGLIVVGDTSVLIVDTPWDSLQTEQLLQWIAVEIKKPVSYCLVTHSHQDRTGGYSIMQQHNVPFVSAEETAALSSAEQRPLQGITFSQDTTLRMAGIRAEVYYPGKGHTVDNRVVWLPAQQVLFGGCLVKSNRASGLGYTAEADLQAWPESIRQLYRKYAKARYVVPGHDEPGDIQLLMHTLELLKRHTQ